MSSVSAIIWASSLPDHCTPTKPFLLSISSVFNTCIPTPLAFLSSLLGILSIGAWLFALPPQLYKNFALSSASGLSVYFLLVWFLGDLANMLGALFTEQAAWQVVVATYFVMVDVILCGQYIWYERLRSWREKHQEEAKPLIEEDGDYDNAEGLSGGISVSDEISEDGRQDQPVNGAASSGSTAKGGKAFTSRHDSDNKSAKTLQSPPASQKAQKPTSYLTEKPKITRIKHSALPLAPSQQTLLLLSILCVVLANASPLSPTITTAPRPPLPVRPLL